MQSSVKRKWTDHVVDANTFKSKCMQWSGNFSKHIILDTCSNTLYANSKFDVLFAVGEYKSINVKYGNAFSQLQTFIDESQDWLFGFLGYDLKNEVEKLQSNNSDQLEFPDLLFFVPIHIIIFKGDTVSIGTLESENIFQIISDTTIQNPIRHDSISALQSRITKQEYLDTIARIKEHILIGDVYEMNYCFELFAENSSINPTQCFNTLIDYSASPFSALLQWDALSIISASPERFLKKSRSKIISQPIKGTIRRGISQKEDAELKHQLATSEKDKAENVMITDLVRNDLTKFAMTGSIQVDALFEIKSFRHVHQMVSTISAELKPDVQITDVIKNAFPMGSMTGAPKVMAMELIEKYESTKRGSYSGALGYITPENDFDFNVLIRSIFYNRAKKYISIQAGSAITWDSDAESEYEECLLKAESLIAILQSSANH
ncbi:MAG: anthranilate synthase component I family protein [Chitinophagales bacterium]|nr:anthranilate synthase component I family protein [Chitinophagales bacterium]